MNNFKEKLIEFLTSKKFEAFLWMTANGFITLIATYLIDIDWVYAIPAASILNVFTKYINQKYLKD